MQLAINELMNLKLKMNYKAHWYNNLINLEFVICSIAIWIIANKARVKQYDFAQV